MPKAENGTLEAVASAAEFSGEFLEAARYGDLEDIRAMAAQGVRRDSSNERGRTALHMASANGHLEVVQYLISQGADMNAKKVEDNTPLHYASLNSQIPVLPELIDKAVAAVSGVKVMISCIMGWLHCIQGFVQQSIVGAAVSAVLGVKLMISCIMGWLHCIQGIQSFDMRTGHSYLVGIATSNTVPVPSPHLRNLISAKVLCGRG
ncbi:hypothetical protein R1sor_011727 [Riccia sorocarpa]|uniref:Uncharacterized protein n=1 Tax=Riccia sorocarpa TaxID=122646 RepID=A0ABD3I316_9MARC